MILTDQTLDLNKLYTVRKLTVREDARSPQKEMHSTYGAPRCDLRIGERFQIGTFCTSRVMSIYVHDGSGKDQLVLCKGFPVEDFEMPELIFNDIMIATENSIYLIRADMNCDKN